MRPPRDMPGARDQESRLEQLSAQSYVPLWRAVNDLSLLWRQLPVVRQFSAVLPRNAGQRNSGVPGRLQEMQAGGAGISERPLRVTRTVRLMGSMPSPFNQAVPAPQEWNAWYAAASRVESAHRITVAWLRSRMPGYPGLPAPQLAPGTPLTAEETDFELVWTRGERAQGLQFQNPPLQIGQLLEAAPEDQRRLVDGTQVAAIALEQTEEWERLNATTAALTDSARVQLRHAREAVAGRLSKAEIDMHSQNLMARFNHRVAVLKEVIDTLSGAAKEYASAFDSANRMINIAASDVFGELTVYGSPISIPGARDIDFRPGSLQLIGFTRDALDHILGFRMLEVGQIIWLDDALLPDAVRLIGTTFYMNTLGATERWTGSILPGTSNAWSA
jgi:hypothetical protein